MYVNKAFERLTGHVRHEALGKDWRYLQANEHEQPELAHATEAIKAAEPVDVTLRNYRKDGSTFWNRLSLKPIAVGGELFYLGILPDVSASQQTDIAPNGAANIDVTTGCLNRQSFVAAVDRRFSTQAGPGLIVKLDVVGFHDVNAGYGFDVGDDLLHETGRRLRETGAALVGRMGANEFALAFDLPDEDSGQKIAAGISNALFRDFIVPGRTSLCVSRSAMRSANLAITQSCFSEMPALHCMLPKQIRLVDLAGFDSQMRRTRANASE